MLRDAIADDPRLLPGFIEEVLRYETPVKAVGRAAVKDHEVKGHAIHRGERVMLLCAAANRDPDRFERADDFSPGRTANRHLSFGAGAHRCVGNHIARLTMTIAIREWLRHVPSFEVDAANTREVPGSTWGFSSLPVRWPV
jgi:cytochrome P450